MTARSSWNQRNARGHRPRLQSFKDAGRSHAATDAHCDHSVPRSATPHFIEQRCSELRSGTAQWMAKSDRTAIDVDLPLIQPELANDRKGLDGECLIQFDEVDVLQLQSGLPEC